MGDLKVGEGFIDAVMIRVTATGAAAVGLAPTCTLTRLSTGARVGLTVAEVSDGIYKVTDMTPGFDDEWLTEWAVAGANTIYAPYKLFKVGGGVIADWEDGGRLDLIIDTLALEATLAVVDGLIDDIIADIGVFPTANYATLAAYVEDIRTRLIAILADVTGLAGAAMRGTDNAATVADGWDAALATILDNFTAIRIGYLDELDFDLAAALGTLALASVLGTLADAPQQDADSVAFTLMSHVKGLHDVLWDDAGIVAWAAAAAPANGVSLSEAVRYIVENMIGAEFDGTPDLYDVLITGGIPVWAAAAAPANNISISQVIRQIYDDVTLVLADTGTTLENRQVSIQTDVQYLQNSELFGSTMQEELQLGAGAADVNLPDIILPNISGTIDRAYLHFKVRMIENTYAGVNKLAGAQSIRIKTDGGAWGVDDIAAITFPDDYITLADSTREAGDVFGGMIDVSSEVTDFNDTYEIRWEDGQVDQDFINFNDIEMFLRVIFH